MCVWGVSHSFFRQVNIEKYHSSSKIPENVIKAIKRLHNGILI